MTPTPNNAKNGTWKNYIIQILTTIVLVGGAGLFSTIVWPAIQENLKQIEKARVRRELMDERVTQQLWKINATLIRIEMRQQADSVAIREIKERLDN